MGVIYPLSSKIKGGGKKSPKQLKTANKETPHCALDTLKYVSDKIAIKGLLKVHYTLAFLQDFWESKSIFYFLQDVRQPGSFFWHTSLNTIY